MNDQIKESKEHILNKDDQENVYIENEMIDEEVIKTMFENLQIAKTEISGCTKTVATLDLINDNLTTLDRTLDRTSLHILNMIELCCDINLDRLNESQLSKISELSSSISTLAETTCTNLNNSVNMIQELLAPVKFDLTSVKFNAEDIELPSGEISNSHMITYFKTCDIGYLSWLQLQLEELNSENNFWLRAPKPQLNTMYIPTDVVNFKAQGKFGNFTGYRIIDDSNVLEVTSKKQRKQAIKDAADLWKDISICLKPYEKATLGIRRNFVLYC